MEKIIVTLALEVEAAFEKCGYNKSYGKVTLSNRPDLCEYQCNGALAAAKVYKKAPIMIANEVADILKNSDTFLEITAINPGFINIKLSDEFVAKYLNKMISAGDFGYEKVKNPKKIVLDYGGPNVAKPLHIGHLRSAIIGESIKRIMRFAGDEVIGDVHLGDWGLQMGLIIEELKERKPDLPYFDENFTGEYPKEAPFTISELEEIYPAASAKSKENQEFMEKAHTATYLLQNKNPGYMAIWNHILNVSVADLKKNYEKLNVTFDLWKKESDAMPYIKDMIEMMKEKGVARESDNALVVDIQKEDDTKEYPPCIVVKSDGSSLYTTTDLATLVEREKLFNPNEVIYVVDKRQELHFIQVFRTARKAGIVTDDTKLTFLGFGTMNGKDGKPFKTRSGGVMRLEQLIGDINEAVYDKIMENRDVSEQEARKTAKIVGLAALKYGDLSNQASKDYVFDIDRFTSFEGNTGPYILYTIVRIKSILKKYTDLYKIDEASEIVKPTTQAQKDFMLEIAKFNDVIEQSYLELAPHKICSYLYDLSNAFNRFYHETKIITESDEKQRAGYIALIKLAKDILIRGIDLLGFSAPDRM